MKPWLLWTIGITIPILLAIAFYFLTATWPHCQSWQTVRQNIPAYGEYTWNAFAQQMQRTDHPAQTFGVGWDYCTAPIGGAR